MPQPGLTQRKRLESGKPLRQVAALPYRFSEKGTFEFLLITARSTRRFIVPKGWPSKQSRDWQMAATEARQEAGITGKVAKSPCGRYLYEKRIANIYTTIRVDVYSLRVKMEFNDWPEKTERSRRWLCAEDAILLIDEPGLIPIICRFSDVIKSKRKN